MQEEIEKLYGLNTVEDATEEEKEELKISFKIIEENEKYGKFVLEPLSKGWGDTLGNPLRRTLLNSLPGAAITWARIGGVEHEYSSLDGIKEEVLELLLNLKNVRVKALTDRSGRLRLEANGVGEVTGADIMSSADFEIVNGDVHLASLDSQDSILEVELNVETGTGYIPADKEAQEGLPIGVLPVDAIFTPIKKVNVDVESTRVGKRSDLEKLTIEVWTDGTIDPLNAVKKSSDLLMNRFFQIKEAKDRTEEEPTAISTGVTPEIYNTLVENLDLSARTLNCLKRANLNRVGDVIAVPRAELLKIRNFGQRSVTELFEKLESHGVTPEGSVNKSEDEG
ncbi:MAG: DNA-directed RNA polymerase subunit alpha [Chloroflexi bacterium]|nr:DNA-directed RNA polymerase subunit alpha [Chloroflexota bacterium]|tara:strand:+ start:5049 stop:6065 length:1017 start_codon:yes stop_codon:yes gene_type:complete